MLQYILLLVLLSVSAFAHSELDRAEIDQVIRATMQRDRIPGLGLGIIQDGEIRYLKGYGYEDLARNIAVDPAKTRFRWASISKTLTGVLAAKAVSEVGVDLDEDIGSYFPEYKLPEFYLSKGEQKIIPLNKRSVSLRQLLSHMGGMQHYSNGAGSPVPPLHLINSQTENKGMQWALGYWVNNPLVSIPGKTFHYSTPGFNLAGVVLAKAMGSDFESLVTQWIGVPSEMKSLRADTLWDKAPHRAVGYLASIFGYTKDEDNDISWKLAAGGFISTTQDMARYAKAVMGEHLLSEDEKNLLWTDYTNGQDNYGLGWEMGNRDGRFFVRHGGAQAKARANLKLYPEEGLGFVLMTNSGDDQKLDALSDRVEDVIRKQMDRVSHNS